MPTVPKLLLPMTLFSMATTSAFAQYTQPYPDDGVKIGKLTYTGSEIKPDNQLEKILKEKVFHYSKCGEGIKRTYLYNKIDLNGDGSPELITYVMGDCGGTGGYPLLVLVKKANLYKIVSETTLVRQPIIISNSKTKGWKDLIVSAAGDSAHPDTGSLNHYVALKWNGNRYPSNTNTPSAISLKAKEEINGEVIIAQPAHAPGAVTKAIPLE
jgi:hypothetical protein